MWTLARAAAHHQNCFISRQPPICLIPTQTVMNLATLNLATVNPNFLMLNLTCLHPFPLPNMLPLISSKCLPVPVLATQLG